MTIRLFATLIACTALAACATGKSSAPLVPASDVQLYNTTQLVPSQYTVVQHIWIDSSKTAFSYPTFGTVDEGILAMKEEAGKTGATGVINVLCMDAKGYKDGSLLCYGDAVKFN